MGLEVSCPAAASHTQALPDCPSGNHGAKWSEQPIPSKPARSASLACSSSAEGENSSWDAANQYWGTAGIGRLLDRVADRF